MKKLETLGFKHFCMTVGNLPSSYVESLSYYECLLWLIKYLQEEVIPTVNNNSEAVTELQNLFIELQNYVDSYFDNLDIQEEVNNKLDEMVEDGTLQTLLLNYSNICKIYANVSDMINDETLIVGSKCKTLGYYNVDDGGSAEYIISNLETGYCEELNNNLYAKMIINDNQINIKQLGAKSTDSSLVKNDIKPYIDTYISLLDTYDNLKLYIPSGAYYCSQVNIARNNGFCIIGDEGFTTDYISGTVISSYDTEQDYIFNIGNSSLITYNWKIKNIYFTSGNYKYDNVLKIDKNNIKELKYAINLLYCVTGITDNLFFGFIHGGAIQICSSWENYFKLLNFRYMYNVNYNILNFKTVNTTLSPAANITANSFDSIFIESVFANRIINFEYNSGAVNNNFGLINFEESWININELPITRTLIDLSNWNDNADDVVHMALFGGYTCSAIVDSINIDVIGVSYLDYNNNKYIYDVIFTHDINLGGMNIITDSIEIDNCINTIKLYRLKTYTTNLYSRNIVNNIINKGSNNLIYDVDGINYLECNSPLNKFGNQEQDLLKLQNTITPAYKLINVYGGGTYGLLYSNQNASNNLKLCVKPFPSNNNVNSMTFLKLGDGITLHALIPNGETVRVILHSGTINEGYNLEGTGSFKDYHLEYTSAVINSGHDDVGIRLSNSSVSKNIYIDYIY